MSKAFNKDEISVIEHIHSVENSVNTWMSFARKDEERIKDLESQLAAAKRSLEHNLGQVAKYEKELLEFRDKLSSLLVPPPVMAKVPIIKTIAPEPDDLDALESRPMEMRHAKRAH